MPFDTTPLSFAAIPKPAFGSARQHLAPPPRAVTKADRRYTRAAQTAAELLPDLPNPGEAVHCLMTGTFDLCQVVTSLARRLPMLRHLRVATLCFSKRNAADLLALLAERRGLKFTLVASSFFRAHAKELFERFAADLGDHPGAALTAARSHCKVVTFDLGPGDGLVFEGSANLRSNRNREQLAAVRDRGLHDWHAAWIDAQMKADDGEGPGR